MPGEAGVTAASNSRALSGVQCCRIALVPSVRGTRGLKMKRYTPLRLPADPARIAIPAAPSEVEGSAVLRSGAASAHGGRAKRSRRVSVRIEFAAFILTIVAPALSPQVTFAQHGGGGGHMGGGHFGSGGHFGGAAGGHSPSPSSHVTLPHSTSQAAPPHSSPVPSQGSGTSQGSSPSASPGTSGASFVRPPSQARPVATADPARGVRLFAPPPEHTTIGFPREINPTILQSASESAGSAAAASSFSSRSSLRLGSSSAPLSFSGEGHQIWQNSATASADEPTRFGTHVAKSTASAKTQMRPQPPHVIHLPAPPLRPSPPVVFLPIFGFSPFFGWGCDPFYWGAFGCNCLGFGYGWGCGPSYGYGIGYYPWPPDYSAPSGSDESSNEPSPSTWQNPAEGEDSESGDNSFASPGTPNSRAAVAVPHTLIYLQNGSSYEVADYWLADNKLHYVTTYGGENSVDISQIDMQRTVDANAARGVDFTLHPAPAPPPQLTPPPLEDSQPTPPPAPPKP
jgi:hypothetical protein